MLTVKVPIFPPAPFLTYDLSDVPALVAGLALGAGPGVAVVLLKDLLYFAVHFTPFELIGVPMNMVSGLALVGVTSLCYKRPGHPALWLCLSAGVVAMVLVMMLANIAAYHSLVALMGVQKLSSLTHYLVGIILPFNFIKGLLSGALAWGLYGRVAKYLR